MRIFFRTWLIVLTFVLILVLHSLGWLAPLERGATALLRPVQQLLVSWTSSRGADTGTSDEHVRSLEAQLARLLTENVLLKEERRKNSSLTEQEEFLASRNLDGAAATIIGRSPEGDTQILVLDHGSESGIRVGQPVITENGILVGTIQEAGEGRSTVIALTDTGSSIAGEIENSQRSPGLIQGQHGLTMRMRFIPQNEPVEKDQAVVTSAIDERIPANLSLGIITDVHFTTGDLFQEASVRPLTDIQRLRYVTVLLPR